jgi:hypothetical protein
MSLMSGPQSESSERADRKSKFKRRLRRVGIFSNPSSNRILFDGGGMCSI